MRKFSIACLLIIIMIIIFFMSVVVIMWFLSRMLNITAAHIYIKVSVYNYIQKCICKFTSNSTNNAKTFYSEFSNFHHRQEFIFLLNERTLFICQISTHFRRVLNLSFTIRPPPPPHPSPLSRTPSSLLIS